MPRTSSSAVTSKYVGTRIRAARSAIGITQAELARRMGVAPAYVAAVEAGGRNLTIGQLGAISAALGTQLEVELRRPRRLVFQRNEAK